MYLDKYNLIVQKDMGGSETLHREGMYAIASHLFTSEPVRPLYAGQLEIAPGVWRRHPDPTKWYSDPATTSRDQLIPTIIFLGLISDKPRLWDLLRGILLRGGFAPNYKKNNFEKGYKLPDLMHFYLGLFIRSFRSWPFYPLLYFFDLYAVVAALIDCRPWRDPEDTDDLNAVLQHLQAKLSWPTPLSELARLIYKHFRPRNNGNTFRYTEANPVLGAFAYYFDPRWGGCPEFIDIYRPIIKKYILEET